MTLKARKNIVIILAMHFAVAWSKIVSNLNIYSKSSEICLTPQCVIAAANIIQNMDSEVNPCDDFYNFACGKFLKNMIIPDGELYTGFMSTLQNRINEQLRDILDTLPNSTQIKPYDLLNHLYQECLDTNKIEKEGLADFRRILKLVGGWPVVQGDKWNEKGFGWETATSLLHRLGYNANYLIGLSINPDIKNTTRYIVTLDEPDLWLIREMLRNGTDNNVVRIYYEYMVDIAVLLGSNKSVSERELKESLELEIKIARLCYPLSILYDTIHYNNMTVQELNRKYPLTNWKVYINDIFHDSGIAIDDEDVVNVINPEYIKELEYLLNSTSKRTIANYIVWKMVHNSVPYLTKEFQDKRIQLNKAVDYSWKGRTRKNECTMVVNNELSLSLGSLYVRKYFDNKTKEITETMIDNIKSAFAKNIGNLNWMDDITKRYALEKLTALEPFVGYPEEAYNDKKLQDYYLELQLDTKGYLRSILGINKFGIEKRYRRLRENVEKRGFEVMPSTTVNAMYMPTKNSIIIPAGIIQGIVFHKDNPLYLNYGGIGHILGHEITHGFDNTGRKYDKNGNAQNWWSNDTNSVFEKNVKCMVDQYNNYIIPELNGTHVNGNFTVNENIADNGGIKNAYLAYQQWVKNNKVEKPLPGLNYTPNQLFWISASNLHCSKFQIEILKTLVATDPHSFSKFRVIGSISNSDDFARDFNCPLGSNMNPVRKCYIW